jgi:hypothetical protein
VLQRTGTMTLAGDLASVIIAGFLLRPRAAVTGL